MTKFVVSLGLIPDAISHWDSVWNTWRAEPGTWQVKVGEDAQTMWGGVEFEVGPDLEWVGL